MSEERKMLKMVISNLIMSYGINIPHKKLVDEIVDAVDNAFAEQKAKVIKLCEIVINNSERYCSYCDLKKYTVGDNPCKDCEYPIAKQLLEEFKG